MTVSLLFSFCSRYFIRRNKIDDYPLELSISGESFGVNPDLDYLETFITIPEVSSQALIADTVVPYGKDNVAVDLPAESTRDLSMENNTLEEARNNEIRDVLQNDLLSLENSFCRDFSCCGLRLHDMHELLQHYEEKHVHLEDDTENEIDMYPEAFIPDSDDGGSSQNEADPIHYDQNFDDRPFDILSDPGCDDSTVSPLNDDSSLIFLNADSPVSAFDDSIIVKSKKSFINPLIRRVGDIEDDLGLRVIEAVQEEVDQGGKRIRMMSDGSLDYTAQNHPRIHPQARLKLASKKFELPSFKVERKRKAEVGVTSELKGNRNNFIRDESAHSSLDIKRKPFGSPFDATPSTLNASQLKSSRLSIFNTKSLFPNSKQGPTNEIYAQPLNQEALEKKMQAEIFSFADEKSERDDKPYKCNYPGCDKAYKNANGLKYHNAHGHCDENQDSLDIHVRMMKPYVCNFESCYKRYKNLNGLKYHIEKAHSISKYDANQMATKIVKSTNAAYGIYARSVPSHILVNAIKKKEAEESKNKVLPNETDGSPLSQQNDVYSTDRQVPSNMRENPEIRARFSTFNGAGGMSNGLSNASREYQSSSIIPSSNSQNPNLYKNLSGINPSAMSDEEFVKLLTDLTRPTAQSPKANMEPQSSSFASTVSSHLSSLSNNPTAQAIFKNLMFAQIAARKSRLMSSMPKPENRGANQ